MHCVRIESSILGLPKKIPSYPLALESCVKECIKHNAVTDGDGNETSVNASTADTVQLAQGTLLDGWHRLEILIQAKMIILLTDDLIACRHCSCCSQEYGKLLTFTDATLHTQWYLTGLCARARFQVCCFCLFIN